ncbi:uncharacterized protein LOC126739111 [Anthonomus grandis grandis]|uniref:uncharacterized protein LOC126739111 n=1 Tax=Anthonomus grandis grandis TaxID=2921223 RepID=UPI00216676BB|nr:uncharacterized protein LOC126739111 [Anthonomus grandis grandis]
MLVLYFLLIILSTTWGDETTTRARPIGPIIATPPSIPVSPIFCPLICRIRVCSDIVPKCKNGTVLGSSSYCNCCNNECVIPKGGECPLDNYRCAYPYLCLNNTCSTLL